MPRKTASLRSLNVFVGLDAQKKDRFKILPDPDNNVTIVAKTPISDILSGFGVRGRPSRSSSRSRQVLKCRRDSVSLQTPILAVQKEI